MKPTRNTVRSEAPKKWLQEEMEKINEEMKKMLGAEMVANLRARIQALLPLVRRLPEYTTDAKWMRAVMANLAKRYGWGPEQLGKLTIPQIGVYLRDAVPPSDIERVRAAVEAKGKNATPKTIIKYCGMQPKKGRDILRTLEGQGEYKGFNRARPARYVKVPTRER